MSKFRTVLFGLCLVIVSAAAVVACGGDDDEETGGSGAEATTPAAANDDSTEEADATTPAVTETDAPSDGGDDAADALDACSILTKAEVENAFGVSMLDPELINLPDTPISGGVVASVASCSYVAAEATDSASLSITSTPGNEAAIGAMIDLACQNKDEVSGLGDKACWYSEAHTEIQMKIGATFVDLFVTTVSGDSTEITSGLAEKIAERLG